jgi:predicted phosphohydrolase
MTKLVWATDIHLNFVSDAEAVRYCERIGQSGADAVLLGGDVGEADSLAEYLELLAATIARPIYYVLGNHDYYGSSVSAVREQVQRLKAAHLRWLPAAGIVRLGSDTALVGHDGWGDARAGDFERSEVILSDFLLIRDLLEASPAHATDPMRAVTDRPALSRVMRALGDEAARAVEPLLHEAAARFRRILFLTHVPPFPEACWHRGRTSAPDWLPMFTCQAVGAALRRVAADAPACAITVLCGHTHSTGRARILPNVVAYTWGAQYGRPDFLLLDLLAADFGLSGYQWTGSTPSPDAGSGRRE